jgi:hypothetical protein
MPAKLTSLIVGLAMCSTALADGQTSQSSALHFSADGPFVLVPNSEAWSGCQGWSWRGQGASLWGTWAAP